MSLRYTQMPQGKSVAKGSNFDFCNMSKEICTLLPQKGKNMLIGYVRVSTQEQNEERQLIALEDKKVDKIFTDKASGKNTDRQALKEMLVYVRDGDAVITESISRIARSTRDLLSIIDTLTSKNVEFISLKESIDTRTPQGRFMLTVFAALAELERENILQRQKEGIAIAKANGKYKGRAKIKTDDKLLRVVCMDWRNGKITARQAMDKVNLKPNTFYRRIKELNL